VKCTKNIEDVLAPALFIIFSLLAVKDFVEREKRDKQTKKKDKSVAHEGAASASVSSSQTDSRVQVIDLETINSAELYVDPKINAFANISIDPIRQLCLAADKQVFISIHVLT